MGGSNLVTSSPSALVGKFGSFLAGKAGDWAFKKGLEVVLGSDTDTVRSDIANVLGEVEKVKTAVAELSTHLAEALVQLRSDSLKEPLSHIESLYDAVQDCISKAAEVNKTEQDTTKRQEKLATLQANLISNLVRCKENIPDYLTRAHSFLGDESDNSFVRQVADKACKSSEDMLGYYLKARTLFMGYWLSVVKGIALLQMAGRSPPLKWVESDYPIKRHTEYLQFQQTLFKKVIGDNTVNLVEEVLANGRCAVYFSTSWDAGIRLVGPRIPSTEGWQLPQDEGGVHHKWWLSLQSRDNLNPSTNFLWRVEKDPTSAVLEFTPAYPGVSVSDKYRDTNWWLIKPTGYGSSRYFLKNYRYGGYLYVGWNSNQLIVYKELDEKHDRAFFRLDSIDYHAPSRSQY